jgi:hypothetical protein
VLAVLLLAGLFQWLDWLRAVGVLVILACAAGEVWIWQYRRKGGR